MKTSNLRYILLVVTVIALGLWALAVNVPNTFSAGTTISASEVNDNFQAVADAITVFEDAIDVNPDGNVGVGTTASSAFELNVAGGILGVDDDRAIIGTQGSTSCAGTYGVGGCATTGNGVVGRAGGGIGVLGTSNARGVVGTQGSTSCAGTYAVGGCATSGDGVLGRSSSGRAGFFDGDVDVTGDLDVTGSKNFRIDHPLDPANRYLRHFSMESNEVLNVYSGRAAFDADGTAAVRLPAYFEALNTDVRYQLTPIGAPMPNLHVAEPVASNRFEIAGGVSGMEVSWQVTATRNDPAVRLTRSAVEEWKPLAERGTYLVPEAFEPGASVDDGSAVAPR